MKIKNIFLPLLVTTLIFGSCSDLDQNPEGEYVSSGQKEEVEKLDPTKFESAINGLFADMNAFDIIGNENHYDYGYPAICLMMETEGQDMPSPGTGYNHFLDDLTFQSKDYTGDRALMVWTFFYKQIKSANLIIGSIDKDTENDTYRAFRGQAIAMRAFSYFNLVQLYQFTYVGHENDPAIPIVTEETSLKDGLNNPRKTVGEVYSFILTDLNDAIDYLKGYQRSNKNFVDEYVAHGLRARVNLVMNKGEEAASDAQKAMEGGAIPASISDVSTPGFNNVSASSWIWGSIISESSSVVQTGIINWPSMLCSFSGNGYATLAGVWRMGSVLMWDKIPSTDVRKGWWVDEDLKSPLSDNIKQLDNGEEYPIAVYLGYEPYTNVKFGAYNNEPMNTTNAQDWPLMRIEEMILIKAEGLARANRLAEAKKVLEDFVKDHRNPSYVCNASSQSDIIDEIWFQRRIELWGEGFAFFDLLRLKKPIIRYEGDVTNYPATAVFNLNAESQILLWRIPINEINTNKGIPSSANNPIVPYPTPVAID